VLPGFDGVLDAVTQAKPGIAPDILHLAMEHWRARLAPVRELPDTRARRIGS
jgi:hypothetical protein